MAHLWMFLSFHRFSRPQNIYLRNPNLSYQASYFSLFWACRLYITWTFIVTTTNDKTRNLCTLYYLAVPSWPYTNTSLVHMAFELTNGTFRHPII